MNSLKLTIIVPTRERADTLNFTLKTIIEQDYPNLEIIVSDNFSQDNTKQVVESFANPNIRYINTGKRLSMSDNWEFALTHVTGDFVTYIGDDDGYIPGAIAKAMHILESSQNNALAWAKLDYCWPDHIDENLRNFFSIKYRNYNLQTVNSKNKLKQVMKFRDIYTKLPCLYNAIVKVSIIKHIQELSTNKIFFNSISPDVYSGIVISKVIDNYLFTDYPFTVNGASRHSNGTSYFRQQNPEPNSPKAMFIAENQRQYDARIDMGPSTYVCVMGEYLLAKLFLPTLHFQEPYWRHYLHALLRYAKKSFIPNEVLQSARHTAIQLGLKITIPETINLDNNLLQPKLGFAVDSFNFIAPINMVKNIYDACHLVAMMLPKELTTVSPIKLFITHMTTTLITELKQLYRSI